MRGKTLAQVAVTLFILLVAGTIAPTPLCAQNQERDVQALLANDDAKGALKQQLAARQITAIEFRAQAQQLAKARGAILARYDRTAQRELVAAYRAALIDKRASAVEAQRKAAVEARAKAIEDAQARQAAKQEAAAQAAQEADAATAKAVEDDAERYTSLMLRHDELAYRSDMQKAGEPEKSEIAQLLGQSEDIKRKYARGGPSQAQAARFETRTKELAAEKLAPAKQQWITASFPDGDQILAGFSSEARRVAALRLIDTLLYEQAGQPQSPATAAKIAGYREEMKKLDPEHQSSKHLALQEDVYKLMHDSAFQYEVTSKFAPAFAGAARQTMKHEQYQAQRHQVGQKTTLAIVATGLLMFVLPLLYLLRGERDLQFAPKDLPDAADAFQLPKELRIVRVFRKITALGFECGLIYDHSLSTEQTSKRIYDSSDTYDSYGNLRNLQDRNYTTSVEVVTWHTYRYRTPDGRDSARAFANNTFPAEKGQIISTIDFGPKVVIAFNNSNGKFVSFGSVATRVVMMMRGWWLWAISFAIAIAGAFLTVSLMPESEEFAAMRGLFAIPVVLGVLSAAYLVGLKIAITAIRKAQFRIRWVPKYKDFMKGLTPQLERFYSATERA